MMIKEVIITFYLCYVKLITRFNKLFSIDQNKLIIFATFPENNDYLLRQLSQLKNKPLVILVCLTKLDQEFNHDVIHRKYQVNTINIFQPIIFFHLMTSGKIIVDNYIGWLSSVVLSESAKCIQIWHANGAIKKFGLADHSIRQRGKRAYKRFLNVYKKFDKVVVGSDEMAFVFQEAFGLEQTQILKFGIPRTDLFFDKEQTAKIKLSIRNVINNYDKKVILYAPTFRDHQTSEFKLELNLDEMYEQLSDEYILILKLHPSIKNMLDVEEKYDGFVKDFSNYKNINHLLLITDILISDYSSIPFEFSLLIKPMIFFSYDLEEYMMGRGLWYDYNDLVPGPVATTTTLLVDIIKNKQFKIDKIKKFSQNWNQYNDGDSTFRLVSYLVD